MKNLLISFVLGLVILCAIGVTYLFYTGQSGKILLPAKKDAANSAVVSDEKKTTEHQVMKPVLPDDENKAKGDKTEPTLPESDEPDAKPNDKN